MSAIRRLLAAALLAAIAVVVAASVFDHHAAERDPFHDHVVVGASGSERARALAAHTHLFGRSHEHDSHTGRPIATGPVISITRGAGAAAAAILGVGGAAIAAPAVAPPIAPPVPAEPLALLALVLLAGLALRAPTPPPRLAPAS